LQVIVRMESFCKYECSCNHRTPPAGEGPLITRLSVRDGWYARRRAPPQQSIMPDQHYDNLMIGSGIVGLSTAMHVLRLLPDSRLLVVEKEENIAQHQSGHNSGVIH